MLEEELRFLKKRLKLKNKKLILEYLFMGDVFGQIKLARVC
jgi:hypothetical protein